MTVTQKQYSQLAEMGINVWKSRAEPKNSDVINELSENSCVIEITAESLVSQRIFLDVLRSVNCEIGDINVTHNTIDLGLINWQFSSVQSISFEHNVLTTPELSQISASLELKRSLWNTLNQKVLS